MTMNPAERYGALKLLSEGIAAALKDAQADADAYRKSVRAKSLETDFGSVSITRRKPSIRFDSGPLADWCKDEYPELVKTTISIPATSETWLKDNRFTIDGDDVLDTETGEIVEWAHVSPGSEYLTFRAEPTAKAAAVAAIASRVELLAAAITPAITDKDN